MSRPHDREVSRVPKSRSGGRWFDREYGVTTQAVLLLTDLDPDAVGDAGRARNPLRSRPRRGLSRNYSRSSQKIRSRVYLRRCRRWYGPRADPRGGVPVQANRRHRDLPGPLTKSPKRTSQWRVNHKLACHDVRLVRDDARIAHYPPGDWSCFSSIRSTRRRSHDCSTSIADAAIPVRRGCSITRRSSARVLETRCPNGRSVVAQIISCAGVQMLRVP